MIIYHAIYNLLKENNMIAYIKSLLADLFSAINPEVVDVAEEKKPEPKTTKKRTTKKETSGTEKKPATTTRKKSASGTKKTPARSKAKASNNSRKPSAKKSTSIKTSSNFSDSK